MLRRLWLLSVIVPIAVIACSSSPSSPTPTPPVATCTYTLGSTSLSLAGVGGTATLPSSVQWTGTIRRNAGGFHKFVISAPSVGLVNQVVSMTLNGSTLQFNVVVDALYTFTATLSSDRRSFTGVFSGGTWAGTRQ